MIQPKCFLCNQTGSLVLPAEGCLRGNDTTQFTGLVLARGKPLCDGCRRKFHLIF
jgi:hypothetical protein